MKHLSEDAFQNFGYIGEFLSADLLTSPIRRIIHRDAERVGIDLSNPRRSFSSLLGSCGMGAALGAVLGPPGGLIGSLFGYVVAIGSHYEGDKPTNTDDSYTEEAVLYILELKAFQIAAEKTQDLVAEEIWADICEEIDYAIETLSEVPDPPESLDDAIELLFDIVSESIKRVDFTAYMEFFTAYDETRWEFCL